MTADFKQLVLNWNNQWRFDYWYREKYNVAFNSEQHRSISQIDIKFDYTEKHLAEQQRGQYEENQKRLKEYEEKGIWLRESESAKKKEEDLMKHLSIDSI